jgi:hypothetical protein
MPQSLSKVILHIVFSTKNREPWLESSVRALMPQQEHHRTRTFQEEYSELLRKHSVQFDERYVWD